MTTTALPTLTAKTPEDVLAAVPLVLGFVPEDSVVMLTSGAAHPFHARLDLPLTAARCRDAAESLIGPARRHGVERVLFVLYAGDARVARACARALVRRFRRGGVEVTDVLRSTGGRWFPLSLDGSEPDGPGTPYDVRGHLFTAQAVAAGRVTRASRGELAATVAADPARRESMAAAVPVARASGAADDPVSWLPELVARLVEQGSVPDPPTTARLLVAIAEPAGRDVAMADLTRDSAERWLPLFSALVRAAPRELVAPAGSVLGFLAWLSGDGALAWCALDRAAEGDPPCTLATAVADALELALPPDVWVRR
ncbi:MAG: DUF4192 domain-containing protein [Nocardioides sp.]